MGELDLAVFFSWSGVNLWMRAIQPPQHGWKKKSLMHSGCEGKICSGPLSQGEGRRKEAVRLLPGSVWRQSATGRRFPAAVKEALCYITCTALLFRQSHSLKATPSLAFRCLCFGASVLTSSQQNTPVYKASFCPNPCPSYEEISPSVNEAQLLPEHFVGLPSLIGDFSMLASELST